MKHFFIFLSLVFLLIVCKQNPNSQVDEGQVDGDTYRSEEIGWSIEIPEGWNVVRQDTEKGKQALEKTGAEIELEGFKQLITFQKDALNSLISTSQPFQEEYPGEEIDQNKAVKKLIYDTYVSQGIKADTLSRTETIDGLQFNTFESKIYAKDGKLILTQILYSKLINGFDFGISVNYNNDSDRDIILKAVRNSKFEKH